MLPEAAHDTHLQATCVGSRAEGIVNEGPVAVCMCVCVCMCVHVCVRVLKNPTKLQNSHWLNPKC